MKVFKMSVFIMVLAGTLFSSTDGNAAETPKESPQEEMSDVNQPENDNSINLLLGQATPFSEREPLLKAFSFEADIHFGLVGTGPTRFRNYIRYGVFDWWEIHTSFAPYPASFMNRFMIGSQNGSFGAILIDGGLAALDAGIRFAPDQNEGDVGVRLHFEGGLAYSKRLIEKVSVYAQAGFRYRYSMLKSDDQNAFHSKLIFNYDLLRNFSLTGGVAYAEVIGTPVRELSINFVDVASSGFSHFLLRDDGWSRSVTLPMSLRYGRVSSFDVDLFITPRVWPQFDVVFGAGLRWRIIDITELWK